LSVQSSIWLSQNVPSPSTTSFGGKYDLCYYVWFYIISYDAILLVFAMGVPVCNHEHIKIELAAAAMK